MADKQKKRVVIIEEGTLTTLATREDTRTAFPFLEKIFRLQKPNSGCGGCAAKAAVVRNAAYAEAKTAIAGLSSENKRKLKSMIGATEIQVVVKNPQGRGGKRVVF